jgi:hypothetical protein
MSSSSRALSLVTVAAVAFILGQLAALPSAPALAADQKPAAKAKSNATFEVYKDKSNEFRWRLRTTNKQVIATSGDGYKSRQDCLSGIESVKKNAPDAPVEEEKPAQPAAK